MDEEGCNIHESLGKGVSWVGVGEGGIRGKGWVEEADAREGERGEYPPRRMVQSLYWRSVSGEMRARRWETPLPSLEGQICQME